MNKLQVTSYKLQVRGCEGLTLIEVIVSATILAVALTIAATIFLAAIAGQRKTIAMEHAFGNARILLDMLSREIRVSQICGDTNVGNRACADAANNTPTSPPNTYSKALDIIRGSDGAYISYCIREYPGAIPHPFAELWRVINDENFSIDACNLDNDPGNPAQKLNSDEAVLLMADSGFIVEGVGQAPSGPVGGCNGVIYDVCQPRATIVFHVQSVTQKEARERTEARVQTTISQRLVDVP